MARQIIEVGGQVGNFPVKIRVVEFPIIEDIVLILVTESITMRKLGEPLSEFSAVERPSKDFIIKTNVVGG